MISVIPLWVTHGVVLLGLLIGSITDLKKREVPDFLNFGLMAIGIMFGGVSSIFSQSIWPLVAAIAGFGLGYIIGALMFYGGQWGGGDAKMLMGIGALLGVDVVALFGSSLGSYIPLFIIVLISIILSGAIYGFIYLLVLIVVRWKTFRKEYMKKLRTRDIIEIRRIISAIIAICIVVALLLKDPILRVSLLVVGGIVFTLFNIILATKVVEQHILTKFRDVAKITEGEWIVKNITKDVSEQSPVMAIKRTAAFFYIKKNDGTQKEKNSFINKRTKKIINQIVIETYAGSIPFIRMFKQSYLIINKKKYNEFRKKIIFALHLEKEDSFNKYIKKNNLTKLKTVLQQKNIFFDKLYICGPKDLGILQSQIYALKRNKIKTILIKEGIPFIPGFLLGYLLVIFFGNYMSVFLSMF